MVIQTLLVLVGYLLGVVLQVLDAPRATGGLLLVVLVLIRMVAEF